MFYGENNPIILLDIMKDKILHQANHFCPVKSFRVKALKEPWITNEAVEAIRDKDKLLQKAKRSRREVDWIAAREARNRVGRDLEKLRADFLKTQQENNNNDPKRFWNTILSILPGKKGKSTKIWLKNQTNTFFTNIGKDLASQYNEEWRYFGDVCQNSLENFGTNAEEVLSLCKEINTLKSSGMDLLSSKLCKYAFLVLTDQLIHLFNCSLAMGIFPDKWKIAKVLPLFKGGDRENVNNYRPISLLPLPGNMLEKIVHKRI